MKYCFCLEKNLLWLAKSGKAKALVTLPVATALIIQFSSPKTLSHYLLISLQIIIMYMITAIEPVESSMFKNNNIYMGSMINDRAQTKLGCIEIFVQMNDCSNVD